MIDRRRVLQAGMLCAAIPAFRALALDRTEYEITAMPGAQNLLDDNPANTAIWGYQGMAPGPLIRARQGEEITVHVINGLDQPTTVHWHGLRIDNAMDGVAGLTQEPIPPGERFTYRFTPPDAGTYWYHPHNRTWEQLARGLYGGLIVEERASPAIARDHLIVADDWRLDGEGAIHEASLGNLHDWAHEGRLGNILTLNGKPYERLPVTPGERVRLRIVNAANARTMRFAIAGHAPVVIALDGQPVAPRTLGEAGIELAASQRADLLVDIDGGPGDEIAIVEKSGPDGLIAGWLVCGTGNATASPAFAGLPANPLPEPDLANARPVEIAMNGGAMRFLQSAVHKGETVDGRTLATEHRQVWAFNGVAGMGKEPIFTASRGETLRIVMSNETMFPHAIHLHGHHFTVLSRKGAAGNSEAADIGAARDTVLVAVGETVEVALVADNPGKWMLHCHMLEHQAAGMSAWFGVS